MALTPDQLSANGRRHLSLIERDADEELLYEIRKHPVGLFIVFLTGFLIAVIILAITMVLAYLLGGERAELGTDLSFLRPTILVVGGLLSAITIIVTAINAYLYQSNVVYVTSDKIAQVLYRTIFDRKISQLSIGDVQDVTTTQKGLLAQLFNYGTLVVETAGEQSNYAFTYTPKPYEASKAIVNAHEENLKKYGN